MIKAEISIADVFAHLERSDADWLFNASDGRQLPVFRGFAKRIQKWREHTALVASRSDAAAQRKVDAMSRRIAEQARLFREQTPQAPPWDVLEVAAGTGTRAIMWARQLDGRVVATDVLPWFERCGSSRMDFDRTFAQMLKAIDANAAGISDPVGAFSRCNVDYRKMDARHLEFPDASLDLVICYNALMEIPQIERVIDEIHRVLRPGGMLCATWDFYFHWIGAHRKGAIDIPWGHALLSRDDYCRFTSAHMSATDGRRAREYTAGLNRLTEKEWMQLFDVRFKKLRWMSVRDTSVMRCQPAWIQGAVPPGITPGDLLIEGIDATMIK